MIIFRLRHGILFSAVALLLGAFSSQATAGTKISSLPNYVATCPRLAVDAQGHIHAVCFAKYTSTTGDVFYSRSDDAGKTWSSPVNFSNSGTAQAYADLACDVGVDGSGKVHVLWAQNTEIWFRTFSSGTWDTPFLVFSGGAVSTPRISVTSGGDVFACWWSTNGVVRSRARVGGNWEPTRSISRSGMYSKFADISVGAQKVYCVWMEKNGSVYRGAYVKRSISANASWGAISLLPAHKGEFEWAIVSVDSNDVAHVSWTPWLGGPRVVTYTHTTATGFAPTQDISKVQLLHYPSIAVRGQKVCVIWQIGGYAASTNFSYNIRNSSGVWGGPTAIPQSTGGSFSDVAASPNGSVFYFMWDSNGAIQFAASASSPPPPAGKLSPPILTVPANKATGQPLSVTLRWQDTNSNPEEGGYRIRIKPMGGIYSYVDLSRDTTSFVKSGLARNKVYYWNVRAKVNGAIKASDWANAGIDWSFKTIQ
jgi:hypothetical protein